ncbi:MAG: hypothetical protein WEB89_04455 [Balneolales bacterium]
MAEGNIRNREVEPAGRRSIFISKVSWGAIFAGALVAIVVQMVLSMLGLAIGAFAVDPTAGMEGLGIGAAIWWIVTALISLFTGAWVAGRMASISNSFEGMMHGIIVWCVATFVGFMLITTTIGQIMSGAFGIVGQSISLAGEVAGPQVAEMIGGGQQGQQQQQQGQQQGEEQALEDIMAEMRQLVQEDDQGQAQAQQQQQDGGPLAQQQQQQQGSQAEAQELEQAVSELLQEGEISPQQRQQVVSMLQDNTQMDQQQAEQTVDNWISTYEEATSNGSGGTGIDTEELQAEAAEIGDEVADVLATAAFWSFIALVLGAIVAGVGGSVAAPTEEERRERERDVIDRRSDIESSRERDTERAGGTTSFERDPNDPSYRGTSERRAQEPGRTTPARNEPRMPGDPNPDDSRGKKGRNI